MSNSSAPVRTAAARHNEQRPDTSRLGTNAMIVPEKLQKMVDAAEGEGSLGDDAYMLLLPYVLPLARSWLAQHAALEVAKPVLDWRRDHSHPFLAGPHVEDAAVIDAALDVTELEKALG